MSTIIAGRAFYWWPAAASVLLHLLLLSAVTLNWSFRQKDSVQPVMQPKHIVAKLVAAPRPAPAPRRQPVVARPEPAPVTPKPSVKPAQPQRPKPKPKPAPEVTPRPEPQTLSTEEQTALARRELALAVAGEADRLEQSSDEAMANRYIALISNTVQNHWSRPPSARNGMVVELVIQLIPSGEVVSVTVARSSGLLAFDRSAVNAVQKAARFPELQQLPPRVFERSFRRFRLLFKPEDLRF
ncbi:MAG: cell envelope integrity protein TolA [Halieaceae bacterium]|nr:cell envelope integrity protein TolA [Halieaceae bacterium]